MKDYSDFTAVELAQDDDFIRWVEVGHRDEELDKQWNVWLAQNPGKVEMVNEARRIISAVIHERQYFLHDSKHQELWSRIENTVAQKKNIFHLSKMTWYGIAASLVLFIVAGIVLFRSETTNFVRHTAVVQSTSEREQLLSYKNESAKPHKLVLEDGSVVTLQPHSFIEYPEVFPAAHRDVYLVGEAFFEVTRNPQKPFFVHANEIVTRVLGTSFMVRAYDKDKDVVVAVRTGKVSVFTEKEHREVRDQPQNLVGTLLTPNQQITFSREDERMIKSLVEEPVSLRTAKVTDVFHFNDTPIREVFARLEKAYGVEIIFDEEVMSDCYLTTSLDNISFYDQLRLICKGINAKYETLDAHVIITGNGCK